MLLLLLSAIWLVIALLMGFAISYSGRTNKLPQIGLGFIFGSFGLGLFMLAYSISQVI
jgi:hypothetical protein